MHHKYEMIILLFAEILEKNCLDTNALTVTEMR